MLVILSKDSGVVSKKIDRFKLALLGTSNRH
jgi:hypothetical protein